MNRIIFLMTILILLSSCSSQPNLNEPKSQHTDLSYPEAEKRGYVVAGPSGVANVDLLENFFQDYQNKKTNKVTIARYTDEGDPIYVDLVYDGKKILFTYDNTWDAFGGGQRIRKTSCTNLGKRTGSRGDQYGTEYFLTSCKDDIGYSEEDNKEYYILFIEEVKK